MYRNNINNCIKALLIFGSALIFVCCGVTPDSKVDKEGSKERLLTESSDSLTVVMSKNGLPSYIFKAPRVDGYALASEPYREFIQGVEIVTYSEEEPGVKSGEINADYAIYYEERQLWEAVGNVEVLNSDGKELYSEQLFWNAQTKRIYSNVDTKIMDNATGDVYFGEGFESDEAMDEWSFRKMKGRMKMIMEPRKPLEEESAKDGDDESTDDVKPESESAQTTEK